MFDCRAAESIQLSLHARLPRPITVAGDTVSGSVDLEVKRPVNVFSVEARLGCESIGRVKVVSNFGCRDYKSYSGQRYLDRQTLFHPMNGNVTIDKDIKGLEFEFQLPYDVHLSSYHVLPSDSRIEWYVEAIVRSGSNNGDIVAEARYPFEFHAQPLPWVEKSPQPFVISKTFSEQNWWQWLISRSAVGDKLEMTLRLPHSRKLPKHPCLMGVGIDVVGHNPSLPPVVERITIVLKSKRIMTIEEEVFQSFMRDESVLIDEEVSGLEEAQRLLFACTIPHEHHESFTTPQLRLEYKLVVELVVDHRKLRLSSPVEILNTISDSDSDFLPPYVT